MHLIDNRKMRSNSCFRSFLLRITLVFLAADFFGRSAAQMASDWFDEKFQKIAVPEELEETFWSPDAVYPRDDRPPAVRKEYRRMTDEERRLFHDCVVRLRQDPMPDGSGITEYQMYIFNHRSAAAPGAHFGPAFCPWHREFLTRFEVSLRNINPNVCLPYWDSTIDHDLPDPSHSMIFSDDFLGTCNGVVDRGFMAYWDVVPEDCQEPGQKLTRDCDHDGSLLMSDQAIEEFYNKSSFAKSVVPYDMTFETKHGEVHTQIGGHMMSLTCAPNDMIFFLHHCFIDYLFEKFKKIHPGTDDPQGYPDDLQVPVNQRRDDPMLPFREKTNADGLSNEYTAVYYTYEESPKYCDDDSWCGSKYLWCDLPNRRCKGKVKEGGNCTGLPDNACCCTEPGKSPECFAEGQSGKCRCNEEAPPCQVSNECESGKWCDRQARQCRMKVSIGGSCVGMPREACSGPCELPTLVYCMRGKCGCAVQKCSETNPNCPHPSLRCDTTKGQCLLKLNLGENCTGMPRGACSGLCELPKLVFCIRGKCGCALQKCSESKPNCPDPSLYCNIAKGQCLLKLNLGENCTGMPREACSVSCQLPKVSNCVRGKTCGCAVEKCSQSSLVCPDPLLWCNTTKGQCVLKLELGKKCSGLPDDACRGPCALGEFPACRKTCKCVVQ